MNGSKADSLLQKWSLRVKRFQLAHRFASKELMRTYVLLGTASIALSTIASTSIFASLETVWSGHGRIVVGLMSLTVALLSGLQTFLRLEDLSGKHQRADASYSSIRQRIEQFQAIDFNFNKLDDVEKTEKFLDEIRQDMSMLSKDSPLVPERHWQKARAVFLQQERKSGNSS